MYTHTHIHTHAEVMGIVVADPDVKQLLVESQTISRLTVVIPDLTFPHSGQNTCSDVEK